MNLTKEQKRAFCESYLAKRQRARTDLFWLCNEVLAPPDSRIMVPHAHDLIVNHCQKFKGCTEIMDPNALKIVASQQNCRLWDLEGPRSNLLLVSRGHLKSTIHCVGQAIQWILNYPDIRILICSATGPQVAKFLKEIKEHFQFNSRLRFLFPEFCPKKPNDFGNSEQFTVKNRQRKWKEETVETASIEQAKTGARYEVIIATDVVTENNIRTSGQIQQAKDFFGFLEPLRERGPAKNGKPNPGWKFVEGTIYDFSDYYQMILDHEAKLPAAEKQWKITRQSCWINKEKRITLWPERFPAEELDRIRNSPEVGPYIFSSQYELDPVAPGTGLASKEQIQFFPAHLVRQLLPRYQRVSTTIDLATLDGSNVNGDFVSMVTAGFDSDGRLDVFSIQNDRFTDEQVVERMFLIQAVYPQNAEFRIQKDQISSGLKTLLRREMVKRKQWLNVKYPPIPTNESKTHRIIRQLRGWFALGLIRFADNVTCKAELIDQILRFPRGAHDDILDALADQMNNGDGEPTDSAIPREAAYYTPDLDTGLPGFDPYNVPSMSNESECYAAVTGL